MYKRRAVKPSKDKKIFSRTADKVKKVNIDPKPQRGGIRL